MHKKNHKKKTYLKYENFFIPIVCHSPVYLHDKNGDYRTINNPVITGNPQKKHVFQDSRKKINFQQNAEKLVETRLVTPKTLISLLLSQSERAWFLRGVIYILLYF